MISLVSLDDRPCNWLFPAQLARIAGWEVVEPPRKVLGWFTEPGDCGAVAAWLQECLTQRVVVSLDMLCYGGLVASRTPAVGLKQALGRLETLRALRRSRSDLVIFAFSTITRLGTTVTSTADLEVHQLLRAYSELVDSAERLGEQGARSELDTIVQRLDPSVLTGYLEVRRRNHAVNRAAIQLVADGTVDYLVLAQEDAAPVGIHIPEQLALRDQVAEFRLADRVAIQPGADEVGLLLLARHCVHAAERLPGIAVDHASDAGADLIPQFENQPLRQTAGSQIGAAGARVVAPDEADAMLFIHTPVGRQRDVTEAPPDGQSPMLALQAESVVERIQAADVAGHRVGLADVAYCNGADPELIAALRRTGAARRLRGFAGWNTSANSIGTVVSQLCVDAAAACAVGSPDPEAARRFLAARFADDYAYQACIRQKAFARAQSIGADPYALGSAYGDLEEYIVSELKPLAHAAYSELVLASEEDPVWELQVSLPWRRLFEAEVELTS